MIPSLLRLITTFSWGGFYSYTTNKITNYKKSFNTHPTKVSRNIVSFTHSVTCSLISYLTLQTNLNPMVLYYFSLSYFLWDNCLILYNKLNEIPYIYHHIVCLTALMNLYYGINEQEITTIFYYGEISNIFNYIVYHLMKLNTTNKSKFLLFVKTIQVGWFSYFRVYVFSQMLYNYFYLLESKYLAYNLGIIYLMGLMWGYKQFQKLRYDFKRYFIVKKIQ